LRRFTESEQFTEAGGFLEEDPTAKLNALENWAKNKIISIGATIVGEQLDSEGNFVYTVRWPDGDTETVRVPTGGI